MRKRRVLISVVVAATVFFMTAAARPALARTPSAYGPEGKRFGAGLYLGEPIGITLKGYLTQRWALMGAAGWSFPEEAFTLKVDGTYDILDIPVDTQVITLPFYLGVGGFMEINENHEHSEGGIVVPVGLAVQWSKYPVEAFVELEPGIAVAPDTEFELMGGIGARFYF
jgi:hypothetical protein